MKIIWKVSIGLVVLLAAIVFMTSFLFLSKKMETKIMERDLNISQQDNVDRLLDEMEFGTISRSMLRLISI